MLHPKKVGTLPVKGCDKEKQTNEIKIAIPLLDSIDICGKTITADALLTQRNFATYLVEKRMAHYHFTAKGNQKRLLEDITFFFENSAEDASYTSHDNPDHGRIETRKIWITTRLNDYLDFPHIGQVFKIERIIHNKKSGQESRVIAYGLTSKTPEAASAKQVLQDNRNHWSIENSCHYIIDWIYDEDRSRISKGYGPENVTRLRRFAVGLLKEKNVHNVTQKMRKLSFNVRAVFDHLKMTKNSVPVQQVKS